MNKYKEPPAEMRPECGQQQPRTATDVCNQDTQSCHPETEVERRYRQAAFELSLENSRLEAVRESKQLRKDLDGILQLVKTTRQSEARYMTSVKLTEAIMWLGMDLKALGEANPYPESKNPDSPKVEPTADGLKL